MGLLGSLIAAGAAPDCSYSYRISNRTTDKVDNVTIFSPGTTTPINNQATGCTAWSFTYAAEGFSALSIQLESANLSSSPNSPAAWTTFSGTTVSGTNPSTNLNSNIYNVTGFNPWIRVNNSATTGTGSINVLVFGWKSPSYISSIAAFPASTFYQVSNNLSEGTPATIRTNLGLTSTATTALSSLLLAANNLSDIGSAATTRTNLGLTTTATTALSSLLQSANNLSDLGTVATARTNLGLADSATLASSTFLKTANNLSDLASVTTARTNLGLGQFNPATPTISGIATGLGTSPSAVTISGTNTYGRISFTTGTSPAAAAGMFTINFNPSLGSTSTACQVQVYNATNGGQAPWVSGSNTSVANIASNVVALAASTPFTLTYMCFGI